MGDLELEKERGKLVDAEVMLEEFSKLVVAAKDSLRSVAMKVAGQVSMCENQDENYRVIQSAIDDALLALSEENGQSGPTDN